MEGLGLAPHKASGSPGAEPHDSRPRCARQFGRVEAGAIGSAAKEFDRAIGRQPGIAKGERARQIGGAEPIPGEDRPLEDVAVAIA